MPPCNGTDRGCAKSSNITPRESGPTSIWSLITRELDQPIKEAEQMAAGIPAGAASLVEAAWYAIDWQQVNQNLRRLQARIVQIVQAGR